MILKQLRAGRLLRQRMSVSLAFWIFIPLMLPLQSTKKTKSDGHNSGMLCSKLVEDIFRRQFMSRSPSIVSNTRSSVCFTFTGQGKRRENSSAVSRLLLLAGCSSKVKPKGTVGTQSDALPQTIHEFFSSVEFFHDNLALAAAPFDSNELATDLISPLWYWVISMEWDEAGNMHP